MSAPLRIIVRLILTIGLVWGMDRFLPQYFAVTGTAIAIVVVASLLTLLNIIVRPILNAVTFPFRLIATLLVIVAVNAAFLWLTLKISSLFDPSIVQMSLSGGTIGWIVVSLTLGLGNWVMKEVIR